VALIIVFGESIIAVGSGILGPASAHVLVVAGLTLCLVIGLWLMDFGGDDERAEAVMEATSESRRGRKALLGYWAAFAVMIGGVLVLAAGAKLYFGGRSYADFGGWIAAGVALYLVGTAGFRAAMLLDGAAARLAGAAVAVGIAFVPVQENAVVPPVLAVALIVALWALDARVVERATG
jgi:low temperature requirement protein LtrA